MCELLLLIILVLILTYGLSYFLTKKRKQRSIILIMGIPIFYLFYFIVYSLLNNGIIIIDGELNAAIVFSNNIAKVSYVPDSQKYIKVSVLNSNKDTLLTKFLRNKHYKNYCRIYISSLGKYNDIPFKFAQIVAGDSLVTDQELAKGYKIISMEISAVYSTKSWDGDSRIKVFHSKNNVISKELLDSISYYGNVSALSIRSVGERLNEPPSIMNSIYYLFE